MPNRKLLNFIKSATKDFGAPRVNAYMWVSGEKRPPVAAPSAQTARHRLLARPSLPQRIVADKLFKVTIELDDKEAVAEALERAGCKTDGSTALLAYRFFDLSVAAREAYAGAYDNSWTAAVWKK